MWHVSSTNDVIFSFTLKKAKKMERVKGIEPSRPAWKAGALPLSYTRKIKKWSEQQDSNLRPPGPKPGALPNCAMPRH